MKKNRAASVLSVALFYLYIFALGLLDHALLWRTNCSLAAELLILCGSIVLGALLQTPIHESGHLLFGLLTGWKLLSFRLYSWIWIHENGKVRVKRQKIAGTAGQCLMLPPDTADGDMPYALYNMGGVLMNLIAALLFGGIAFLLKGNQPIAAFIFATIALYGVYAAATNGIPMRFALISNDGRNLLSLRESPAVRRAFRTQLMVLEKVSNGARLRDMPDEWFTLPEGDALHNEISATLAVLACDRLIDAEQFSEAAALAKTLLDSDIVLIGLHRLDLLLNRVTAELLGGIREDAARTLNEKQNRPLLKTTRQSLSTLRTQYIAAQLGDRDPERAKSIRAQFEKQAALHPYPIEAESERELLALADERAQAFESECEAG